MNGKCKYKDCGQKNEFECRKKFSLNGQFGERDTNEEGALNEQYEAGASSLDLATIDKEYGHRWVKGLWMQVQSPLIGDCLSRHLSHGIACCSALSLSPLELLCAFLGCPRVFVVVLLSYISGKHKGIDCRVGCPSSSSSSILHLFVC